MERNIKEVIKNLKLETKNCLFIFCLILLLAAPTAGETDVQFTLLPLKNDTGDAGIDWLSLGIQDFITDDLWYVSGVNALALPEYILTAGKSPLELSRYRDEEALVLGKRLSLGQIWTGSYRNKGNGILVEISGLDVKTGKLIFTKTMNTSLNKILTDVPFFVNELLKTIGVVPNSKEKGRFSNAKTTSLKAFELYSKAYGIQQELSPLGKEERKKLYGKWRELLTDALREDPNFAEAWNCLGWALYTSGNPEQALNAFQSGLKIKSYMIASNMGVGYVLRDKKHYAEAIAYMEKAVDMNPSLVWPTSELEKTILADREQKLPNLITIAKSRDKARRIQAINAIGATKDVSALPVLGELLKDDDRDINLTSLKAIGSIGGEGAIPYFKDAIENGICPVEAVEIMANISPASALPYLVTMLKGEIKEDSTDLGEAAAEIIGRLRIKEAIPHLSYAIGRYTGLSIASIKALSKIGGADAVSAILSAMKDKRPEVRRVSALSLGRIGAREAVPLLKDAASVDENKYVRVDALIALSLMGEEDPIKSLKEVIIRGDDKKLRDYVVRAVRSNPEKFLNTELAFLLKK